ncbi:DNA methyltransferase [Microbacterium sp. NPDC077644]|uniref:DNA methyltransferase n=1 Tax=Microbacterium sp. NPDC077644 TaxID=3155055 RepID=UPI00344DBA0B
MSRLNDLLRRLDAKDPALAKDLRKEVDALANRRAFGLNFERHVPEAVELPGRPVRRGDKVRVLPPRGSKPNDGDDRLWHVMGIDKDAAGARTAQLELFDDESVTAESDVADLVVVAEFRDPIYPGLVSTGKVERGGDKPYHSVINAENYHALQTLLFTHRGQVDAVYIDPPYNTRDRDWKYNNDYVNSDDLYRHSKWLSFMERRLKLAKELLNPDDSVLIVTIDEKEYLRLGLLLQDLFPQASMQMITSMINKKGSTRPGRFSRSEEYLFILMLGKASVSHGHDNMMLPEMDATSRPKSSIATIWNSLLRRGTDAMRSDRPNMFYPVYVDPDTRRILHAGPPLPLGQDRSEVSPPEWLPAHAVASWPLRRAGIEGRWQVGHETLMRLVDQGRARGGEFNKESAQHSVVVIKDKQMADVKSGHLEISGLDAAGALVIRAGTATVTQQVNAARTIWVRDAHDASVYGSTLVSAMIPGRKFPFPKSLYAVEDALRFFVANKPNATIIDFFSGSGTTTHAVMRLNKQDNGRRQSISVTNNEVSAGEQNTLRLSQLRPGDAAWEEWGICEYVTKPRIASAITGRTPDGDLIKGDYKFTDQFPMSDGFEENVEFFTLTYEAPLRVSSNREFERIAPLLWLRAGSEGRRIESLAHGWDVTETYGVLADLDQTETFVEAISSKERARLAFVVTDEDRLFESVVRELPERVEAVRLYEAYLHNFEIETGRSAL